MTWRTMQQLLMILVCLSAAVIFSGKFGIVRPPFLRMLYLLHGMLIGALLIISLVKLGWIKF